MLERLVPTGFRLSTDLIRRIDDEAARRQRESDRPWMKVTRSDVVVDILTRALPPTQREEHKQKKKPRARRAA